MVSSLLNSTETARRLPYHLLAEELRRMLADADVRVPQRLVQGLPEGASLFVMPAFDGRIAITKLITFTPANAGSPRPTIQGEVVVFDVATGSRLLVLDGPTVTARRTAAVSLLAAQLLAPNADGPLLVIGAGAQGFAHVDAFTRGLGVRDVRVVSRSEKSARALAHHANVLGAKARVVTDADAALLDCPLVVTCTPASGVVLRSAPRDDAFVAAVGAFTPTMVELSAEFCRHVASQGQIVVDTPEAVHEAGDLLQAGIDVSLLPTLCDVVAGRAVAASGPVLFKSCGWAGWDLAAARLASSSEAGHQQAH